MPITKQLNIVGRPQVAISADGFRTALNNTTGDVTLQLIQVDPFTETKEGIDAVVLATYKVSRENIRKLRDQLSRVIDDYDKIAQSK